MEVGDCSSVAHVIEDLLLGDDLDGVVLRHILVTLAVEDLLRLRRHEQWDAVLRQLACKMGEQNMALVKGRLGSQENKKCVF